MNPAASWFKGRKLVIATKHHKEQVIAPLLEKQLGVTCFIPEAFDSDVLGTFSGEVERTDDPLTTARNKCILAMEQTQCDLAIASEGSFGPHPALYFIPADDEILLLLDRKHQLEIVARELSTETNFHGTEVTNEEALRNFATAVKFPSHAIILKQMKEGGASMKKGITDWNLLLETFQHMLLSGDPVFAETDMRALYNPTRMNVIEKATHNLLEKIASICPQCQTPGFSVTDRCAGLPCSLCGSPTRSVKSHILTCSNCSYRQTIEYPNQKHTEDPMYCDVCNP